MSILLSYFDGQSYPCVQIYSSKIHGGHYHFSLCFSHISCSICYLCLQQYRLSTLSLPTREFVFGIKSHGICLCMMARGASQIAKSCPTLKQLAQFIPQIPCSNVTEYESIIQNEDIMYKYIHEQEAVQQKAWQNGSHDIWSRVKVCITTGFSSRFSHPCKCEREVRYEACRANKDHMYICSIYSFIFNNCLVRIIAI